MRARSFLFCVFWLLFLPLRAYPQDEEPQSAPASLPVAPAKKAPSPALPEAVVSTPEEEASVPLAETTKRKRSRLLYLGGYLSLNLGLFAGLHTIHAGLAVKKLQENGGSLEEIEELAEHARLDALIADVLFATGFLSLGAGYIKDQRARGGPVFSPGLFYAASAFSGVTALGAFGLSRALANTGQEREEAPLVSRRLSRMATTALVLSLASGSTGFLLSRARQKKELQVGISPGGVSLTVGF